MLENRVYIIKEKLSLWWTEQLVMHRAAPYSNLNMDQIKQLSQYFAVHLDEELQGFFL